jgi:hypothetical protein
LSLFLYVASSGSIPYKKTHTECSVKWKPDYGLLGCDVAQSGWMVANISVDPFLSFFGIEEEIQIYRPVFPKQISAEHR